MARMIRIEYAGAAYHVMGRGNQGKARENWDCIGRNETRWPRMLIEQISRQ